MFFNKIETPNEQILTNFAALLVFGPIGSKFG